MPLSTLGICHQIIASIRTFKLDRLGTVNDCKVVINHLVRKFSEPLMREGRQIVYCSRSLADGEKAIKEHLFPVNEVMNYLLALDVSGDRDKLAASIRDYLAEALVIVKVTPEEDQKLNACGLQRAMPAAYSDPSSPLYRDPWARYKCAGIFASIDGIDAVGRAPTTARPEIPAPS
ncbi:hypothetical protein [Microbulbifer magnicolonia]|uniref:hypothetical protein n=1 Tax=Microbulbifer magnicolonia TaxID=3109744 RepID=UPI002B415053|nr:hypothetical protein [Microbulbifer sp. GG15]